MKKWVSILILCLLLSGCSWTNFRKMIDDMDWERDDQTVQVFDPSPN